MIISHQHKYLFIELPRTGSTAVSKELIQHYDGTPILYRHATYDEFLRIASPKEKPYFVFSAIRNPLDDAVSLYLKYKNDHKGQFSALQHGRFFTRLINYPRLKRFSFVKNHDADFAAYFLKFYRWPYNNWSAVTHERCDFIIRFECLQEDFSQALRHIGVEEVRPLSKINKTSGKQADYLAYYTQKTIRRAIKVFGPFMYRWDYQFPANWGKIAPSWVDQAQFTFLNLFRGFYWKRLRPYVYARIFSERGRAVKRNLSAAK